MMESDVFDESAIVSRYTRAQAIGDGVLIDVSATAREMGFRFPCALTAAAVAECVTWRGTSDYGQDEAGRLWDVLWMLLLAIKRNKSCDALRFAVSCVNEHGKRVLVQLIAACGPGDTLEPVITVMLPHED